MRLLTLNLSCENVYYPARKHFEKTKRTILVFAKCFRAGFYTFSPPKNRVKLADN